MLEQLKYKNHLNEVFEFGKDGIFVNTNDLHDYEWTVTKKNNKIAAFDYSVSKRKLPIIIICATEEQGIAARNKLTEIVEKDVLAMKHGQVILNGYYFRCFVTKSQKKDYLSANRYMKLTLTLTSDYPFWVRESTYNFKRKTSKTGYLDYPFEYPFDYQNTVNKVELFNNGFTDTNFRMTIYGECSNPSVNIAGHTYHVKCSVGANEYLTIDSVAKTITLTNRQGVVTNVFNSRSRASYIFQKIPAGKCDITISDDFQVSITLLEERSEPKWI